MFILAWFAGPAAAAAILTRLTPRRWRRPHLLLTAGVAVGVAFFVFQYLQAPPDYQHSQGDSDGEMFWGRWWEPTFTMFLIVIGYLFWALGVAIVFVGGAGLDRARRRSGGSA